MLEILRHPSGQPVGIVGTRVACGALISYFFGLAKLPIRKPAGKPREVSGW